MAGTLVVGGGVFGAAAALELARRGDRVTFVDPGAAAHPAVASTDLSKACRLEYGADERYTAWMEEARAGWLAWNDAWEAAGAEPLYHECGVLLLSRAPLEPGGYEEASLRALAARGHEVERLDASALEARFPAWRGAGYREALANRLGGWAESGRVVERLVAAARDAGAGTVTGVVRRLLRGDGGVCGLELASGARLAAERVVVAAGSWSQELVPELDAVLRATGHAVFHLRPAEPDLFRAERFPVFLAEIRRTGWYGFPLHPRAGVVKVALHDRGLELERAGRGPESEPASDTVEHPAGLPRAGGGWWAGARARLDAFLARIPALARAELVAARVCPYADTPDGDFLVAPVPGVRGLVVATGGSGHAFKFAPLLGGWIADAAQGRRSDALERFAWRASGGGAPGEAARCPD